MKVSSNSVTMQRIIRRVKIPRSVEVIAEKTCVMKQGKHVLFDIAAETTADKFKLDRPRSTCHAMKV